MRVSLATLVLALVAGPGFAQETRSRGLATAFQPLVEAPVADGTDLFRTEEREALGALLVHVAETPTDTVRDDCRTWLRRRRRQVPEDTGERFSALDDLLANPAAHRGQPLILWGRTTGHSELDVDGRPVRRLDVDVYDDADRPFAVLLPGDADAPTQAGRPVVLAGYFYKTATRDGDSKSVPVVVAGAVTELGDRLDPDLTATVENLTRSRAEERDAYLTAIAQARMVPVAELERAFEAYREERIAATGFRHDPAEFPTYVDLFRHTDPEHYQGRPVTLRGHVWSVSKVPVGTNAVEYGLETLYELVLYDEDGQTVPAVVVCTEVPDGMPTSGHLEDALEGITVTGYFFKMQPYLGQREKDEDGEEFHQGRRMPMLVARTVSWNPVEAGVEPPGFAVYAGAVLVVVIGLVAVWWLARPGRRRLQPSTVDSEPNFEGIDVDP